MLIAHYESLITLQTQVGISEERAKKSESVAKKAQAEAEKALKEVEIQKSIAESNLQKIKVEEVKNKKLVDAFYFYEDKLALAYKNKKYGFINKEGDVLIDYLYEKVEQFDKTGFAKVKKVGFSERYFLIDIEGNEYPVEFDLNTYPFSTPLLSKNKPNNQVLALDLRDKNFNDFPNTILNKYPNLEILILGGAGTNIKAIPTEISNLNKLKALALMECNLHNLPSELWQIKSLETLLLPNNQITNIPSSIKQLQQLKKLNLGSNQLYSIPIEIGELQNLTQLILADNQIKDLPEEIGNLQKLSLLDLSKNQLNDLSIDISNLQNLKELNLSNNQLNNISLEIENLQNLSSFDLSVNEFESFPLIISKLQNLKYLNLSSNQLENIATEIEQLKELKELNLSNNQFKQFPIEVKTLQNLSQLDVSFNELTALLPDIKTLQNLSYLNLSFNKLDSIPLEITDLKNLSHLDLSGNPLSNLLQDIDKLRNLRLLVLSNNTLSSQEVAEVQKKLPQLTIRFSKDYFSIGNQHFENKNYQDALAAFFTDIEANQTIESYYRVSQCYDELGDYPKAVEYYNKWLKSYNKEMISLENIQAKNLDNGERINLYKIIKKANEIEPNNYISWYNLSSYALYMGKHKQALEAAQKALSMNSDIKSIEANLALAYLLNNQWELAEQIYLKWRGKRFPNTNQLCKEVFSKDIAILMNQGMKHLNFAKAIEIFKIN